jgi:integrase
MNGTVYKQVLPSGTTIWRYEITLGKDENGKPIRIRKSGFKRKGDAETEKTAKLQELNEKGREGIFVAPAPKTFAQLMEEWFREHVDRHCEAKTAERYRQLADYVLPHLGTLPLEDLSALVLERVFNHLKDAGGRHRKTKIPRPLSAKTVRAIASVVHAALEKAVKSWKLIKTNPVDACELPKVLKTEARALDGDQTAWFIDAARGTWLHAFLHLDSSTGARRGELLALTWADLSLCSTPPMVSISKSLSQSKMGLRIKPTESGKPRAVPLPTSIGEALREHRKRQEEHRQAFGPDYRDDLNLVFSTPVGDYLKPDTLTAKVCLLATKAGLDGASLHNTLRHSHGSQLLANGVPLPVVSKRLGHSSVYVTATVYSHALTQDELAAADVWDTSVQKSITAAQKRAKNS